MLQFHATPRVSISAGAGIRSLYSQVHHTVTTAYARQRSHLKQRKQDVNTEKIRRLSRVLPFVPCFKCEPTRSKCSLCQSTCTPSRQASAMLHVPSRAASGRDSDGTASRGQRTAEEENRNTSRNGRCTKRAADVTLRCSRHFEYTRVCIVNACRYTEVKSLDQNTRGACDRTVPTRGARNRLDVTTHDCVHAFARCRDSFRPAGLPLLWRLLLLAVESAF